MALGRMIFFFGLSEENAGLLEEEEEKGFFSPFRAEQSDIGRNCFPGEGGSFIGGCTTGILYVRSRGIRCFGGENNT